MAAAQNRSQKDKEMASYLKSKGVRRTTTACAHHCGAHPQLGEGFLRHLSICRGAQRQPARGRAMARAA